MMVARKIRRQARDAVVAHHFHGAAAPANPHRKSTKAHVLWEMGCRSAELAVADLMRVGA